MKESIAIRKAISCVCGGGGVGVRACVRARACVCVCVDFVHGSQCPFMQCIYVVMCFWATFLNKNKLIIPAFLSFPLHSYFTMSVVLSFSLLLGPLLFVSVIVSPPTPLYPLSPVSFCLSAPCNIQHNPHFACFIISHLHKHYHNT